MMKQVFKFWWPDISKPIEVEIENEIYTLLLIAFTVWIMYVFLSSVEIAWHLVQDWLHV